MFDAPSVGVIAIGRVDAGRADPGQLVGGVVGVGRDVRTTGAMPQVAAGIVIKGDTPGAGQLFERAKGMKRLERTIKSRSPIGLEGDLMQA